MKIAIGCDHRGYAVKNHLVQVLQTLGHAVSDEGTHDSKSVDYPDFATTVARKVSEGDVDRGILICGTGIGMAIAANKFAGVRAATCSDESTAAICRRHNDVNVLCLSGDLLSPPQIEQLVRVWIATDFEGGRHARRLSKIALLERAPSS